MKWFRIPKEKTAFPTTKHYWEWKENLAKEGLDQCVYCAINVTPFGGIRNFHVEHYKPKSLPQFKSLEHDFKNTFFACSICNCFKGNDWPNDPSDALNIKAYPDPSQFDYSLLFSFTEDYKLTSNTVTGKYLIEKLFLNRPQLILERRTYYLMRSLKEEFLKLKNWYKLLQDKGAKDEKTELIIAASEAVILLADQRFVTPYEAKDIQK